MNTGLYLCNHARNRTEVQILSILNHLPRGIPSVQKHVVTQSNFRLTSQTCTLLLKEECQSGSQLTVPVSIRSALFCFAKRSCGFIFSSVKCHVWGAGSRISLLDVKVTHYYTITVLFLFPLQVQYRAMIFIQPNAYTKNRWEETQSSHSESGGVGWYCCREAAGLDRGASVQRGMMDTNINLFMAILFLLWNIFSDKFKDPKWLIFSASATL